MMSTPLGPRLLGVPEAGIERHRLSDLLTSMQRYNREQAVLNARFGLPQQLPEQEQEQPGFAGAAGAGGGSERASGAAGAAQQQRYAESVQQFSRTLAASALWLALSSKRMAEDPSVAGVSLGRLLAKAFMTQQGQGQGQVGRGAAGQGICLPACLPADVCSCPCACTCSGCPQAVLSMAQICPVVSLI